MTKLEFRQLAEPLLNQAEAILAENDLELRKKLPLSEPPKIFWSKQPNVEASVWMPHLHGLYKDAHAFQTGEDSLRKALEIQIDNVKTRLNP